MRILIIIFLMMSCISCSTTTVYAPVTDVSTIESIPKNGKYRVVIGDTLYSIAWRYGLDYQTLASYNNISPPYGIYRGQIIYLTQKAPTLSHKTIKTPPKVMEREPIASVSQWRWPANGTVIQAFGGMNKGINIRGRRGDPIYATAAGKVVYSGSQLRGYGNLIIIKHNSTYLSAYAHNAKVFVKEGSWVSAGQKIAAMGNTGTQHVMLHFEIRKNGTPINPMFYLGRQ
jgi:lipoprotein NlpD